MNTIRIDRIDLHCRGIEAATAQAALDHLGPALLRQLGAARQLLPLLPLLPLREERAGERRAVQTPLNSPLPNPLPVRLAAPARGRSGRGEGEAVSRPLASLNSTAVGPGWGEADVLTTECVPIVASVGGLPEGPHGFEPFIVSDLRLCRRSLTALRWFQLWLPGQIQTDEALLVAQVKPLVREDRRRPTRILQLRHLEP